MKNDLTPIIAIVLLVFFAFILTACSDFSATNQRVQYENITNSVVRIHIRANSNDTTDQEVKLKVRDEITAFLQDELADCASKTEALSLIKSNRGKLEQIANSTLYKCGFNYKSAVFVKTELFPEKTYGDYTFPEGVYDALIIELGSGCGNNWWCVAFPPLCFIPDSDGEKIVYKSWVKEILDKIFN